MRPGRLPENRKLEKEARRRLVEQKPESKPPKGEGYKGKGK